MALFRAWSRIDGDENSVNILMCYDPVSLIATAALESCEIINIIMTNSVFTHMQYIIPKKVADAMNFSTLEIGKGRWQTLLVLFVQT